MSQYKITLMWNQSVMGVSESLYTPDVSGTQLSTLLTKYLNARFALLYPSQYMVAVRLALYGSKRQSVLLVPPLDTLPQTNVDIQLPAAGTFAGSGKFNSPDQLRSVLQLRVNYGDTRSAIRYMSGVPDNVTATEPASFQLNNNLPWAQALANYFSTITALGMSLRARSVTGPNAPASVTAVTSQAAAPSLLGIVITAATAPPIVQGSQVALQHFRPAKFTRSATVNGTWTVDSVNATLTPGSLIVYLRNSGTIDPNTVRLTALSTIQLIGYQLYPIQSLTWIRVGIHKRGRPSLSPRGRRLARPTLDP